MLKTRFLALVAALTVGFAPMLASAAAVKAPVVYDAAGRPIQTTPVINVDTTGTYVAPGGGGGGGAATIASGADVVEGSTADTSTSSTVYGVLQAIKAAAQDTATESPTKVADGSDLALGSTSVGACSTDNGTCAVTALIKRLNQRLTTLDGDLATLHTDMGLAIPAGAALIGKVGTDQTAHGTTDLVAADITKVGGTTLLTGTGAQGAGSPRVTVATDSATVAGSATLPAGSNLIGHTDGAAAALAANTGNPNKVGCVFQTNTTAATTAQIQNVSCDAFGNLGKSFTPAMATQITAQSATTANTANTATLAGAASKLTYISGFTCTTGGATAGSLVTITVAGTITGSMTYTLAVPAGVTLGAYFDKSFPNPVQASAINTAITVQIGAAGSGNTVEQCNAQGFQQ